MGQREQTKEHLKACMADALTSLLKQKPLRDITIDEITAKAGVGRMTYFRNFHSKKELITYKLVRLWAHYTEENKLEDVKHRQPRPATHQNRLRRFACCCLSRTFSSNS